MSFLIICRIFIRFGDVANVAKAAKVAGNPLGVVFVDCLQYNVDVARASEGGRKLYVVGFVSHIHTIIYHTNCHLSRDNLAHLVGTKIAGARKMEVRVGIEPTVKLLQSLALPLGYPTKKAPLRGLDI